jgi:Fur family peroxide stress response transcriptional regulator
MLRMTYQTKLVLDVAKQLGHSTNSDILNYARKTIPELSATTVHRITTRLISHGLLQYGPDLHESKVIDANISKHDHFVCKACSGIKDIYLQDSVKAQIRQQVTNLSANASLTITGDCDLCLN